MLFGVGGTSEERRQLNVDAVVGVVVLIWASPADEKFFGVGQYKILALPLPEPGWSTRLAVFRSMHEPAFGLLVR